MNSCSDGCSCHLGGRWQERQRLKDRNFYCNLMIRSALMISEDLNCSCETVSRNLVPQVGGPFRPWEVSSHFHGSPGPFSRVQHSAVHFHD